MTIPKKLAVEYLKRNKKAASAHVVLNSVFPKLQRAEMFRKAVRAKTVTSFLRSELLEELGEAAQAAEPGDTTSPNPQLNTDDNRNNSRSRTGRGPAAKSK